MKRQTILECLECGEEIEGKVVHDEHGRYEEFPDDCPACGESLDDGGFSEVREDFHADV